MLRDDGGFSIVQFLRETEAKRTALAHIQIRVDDVELREMESSIQTVNEQLTIQVDRLSSEERERYEVFLASALATEFGDHADCNQPAKKKVKVYIESNSLWLECDAGHRWQWAPLRPDWAGVNP